nr:unnamed protein product [Spirometra erinaceieuropaei]
MSDAPILPLRRVVVPRRDVIDYQGLDEKEVELQLDVLRKLKAMLDKRLEGDDAAREALTTLANSIMNDVHRGKDGLRSLENILQDFFEKLDTMKIDDDVKAALKEDSILSAVDLQQEGLAEPEQEAFLYRIIDKVKGVTEFSPLAKIALGFFRSPRNGPGYKAKQSLLESSTDVFTSTSGATVDQVQPVSSIATSSSTWLSTTTNATPSNSASEASQKTNINNSAAISNFIAKATTKCSTISITKSNINTTKTTTTTNTKTTANANVSTQSNNTVIISTSTNTIMSTSIQILLSHM